MTSASCKDVLRKYSTRGWVYRPPQGWRFDEMTPDEIASLKVDHAPGAAPVLFPKEVAVRIGGPIGAKKCQCSFVRYLFTEAHPAILTRFPQKISLVSNIEAETLARYSLEPPVYVGWLWNDEASVCEALGWKIIECDGWGWNRWNVPRRRPPLCCPERTFILTNYDSQIRSLQEKKDCRRLALQAVDEHKERPGFTWHLKQAPMHGQSATLTLEDWAEIMAYFDWKCAYCKSNSIEKLDYLVPLQQDGGVTATNCLPACRACKVAKKKLSAADMRAFQAHFEKSFH